MRILVILAVLLLSAGNGRHRKPATAPRHRKPRTSLLDSPVFWWVVIVVMAATFAWFVKGF